MSDDILKRIVDGYSNQKPVERWELIHKDKDYFKAVSVGTLEHLHGLSLSSKPLRTYTFDKYILDIRDYKAYRDEFIRFAIRAGVNVVAELRRKTGFSQSYFASRYGIPKRTLEKWEQGETHIASYVAALLARAVDEDYIFVNDEDYWREI